jgi:hypothetical protein
LDLKKAKCIVENPRCPYPGQPTFSGTGDMYKENTYVGGVGQEVKPLLDAEEFTGNGNGLGSQYSIKSTIGRSTSGRSSGQFLLRGAGSVHAVSVIPLDAVLLEGGKAFFTFGQQGDPALKFRRLKEAGPGCCLAIVKCHS